MSFTRSVQPKVDHTTIASVVLPLNSRAGMPLGDVRVLVCEEDRERYTILAGRIEFPTGLVSVPPNELCLADGDVVIGLRHGYVEEVLVNRLSPAVDSLIATPTSEMPALARAALACIRRVWRNVEAMPNLGALLHNHEIRSLHGVALNAGADEAADAEVVEAWTVVEDRVQVTWMTV